VVADRSDGFVAGTIASPRRPFGNIYLLNGLSIPVLQRCLRSTGCRLRATYSITADSGMNWNGFLGSVNRHEPSSC
jgi:hypothetical protein